MSEKDPIRQIDTGDIHLTIDDNGRLHGEGGKFVRHDEIFEEWGEKPRDYYEKLERMEPDELAEHLAEVEHSGDKDSKRIASGTLVSRLLQSGSEEDKARAITVYHEKLKELNGVTPEESGVDEEQKSEDASEEGVRYRKRNTAEQTKLAREDTKRREEKAEQVLPWDADSKRIVTEFAKAIIKGDEKGKKDSHYELRKKFGKKLNNRPAASQEINNRLNAEVERLRAESTEMSTQEGEQQPEAREVKATEQKVKPSDEAKDATSGESIQVSEPEAEKVLPSYKLVKGPFRYNGGENKREGISPGDKVVRVKDESGNSGLMLASEAESLGLFDVNKDAEMGTDSPGTDTDKDDNLAPVPSSGEQKKDASLEELNTLESDVIKQKLYLLNSKYGHLPMKQQETRDYQMVLEGIIESLRDQGLTQEQLESIEESFNKESDSKVAEAVDQRVLAAALKDVQSDLIHALASEDAEARDETLSEIDELFKLLAIKNGWSSEELQAKKEEYYEDAQLAVDKEKENSSAGLLKKRWNALRKSTKEGYDSVQIRIASLMLGQADMRRERKTPEQEEAEKKRHRRIFIGAAALVGAGAAVWAHQKGYIDINPFDGDGIRLWPDGIFDGDVDTPEIETPDTDMDAGGGSEEAIEPDTPEPETEPEPEGDLETDDGETGDDAEADEQPEDEPEAPEVEFSEEALTIDQGEGWYKTMQEMGIPQGEWQNLLHEVGPDLVDQGIAYEVPYEVDPGRYRMFYNQGQMPIEILEMLAEKAAELGIDVNK
jgi:hypothetical protein